MTTNQKVAGSNPAERAIILAGVAELADAPDLGSGEEIRGGSSPLTRTSHTVTRTLSPLIRLGVRFFLVSARLFMHLPTHMKSGGN